MEIEEIGTLILKLQDDDIRIPEMRKFYMALRNSAVMRRNAGLVGRMCTLDVSVREEYCRSGISFCLASAEIASGEPPTKTPSVLTHAGFSLAFHRQARGPWGEHIRADPKNPAAIKDKKIIPRYFISEELASLIWGIQELWNKPGFFV